MGDLKGCYLQKKFSGSKPFRLPTKGNSPSTSMAHSAISEFFPVAFYIANRQTLLQSADKACFGTAGLLILAVKAQMLPIEVPRNTSIASISCVAYFYCQFSAPGLLTIENVFWHLSRWTQKSYNNNPLHIFTTTDFPRFNDEVSFWHQKPQLLWASYEKDQDPTLI